MISDRELQQWIDWLAELIDECDEAYLKKTGKLHRADPVLATFLKMNDKLVKPAVDAAVAEFAEHGAWPSSLERRRDHKSDSSGLRGATVVAGHSGGQGSRATCPLFGFCGRRSATEALSGGY
jgi:hypothetical protein